MRTRLTYLWEIVKSGFWFIPVLIVLLGIAVAILMIFIDYKFRFEHSGFISLFYTGSVDSARSILSTIAGAMLGVAGVVFSITLVVLTLASSQFGSRLIRNFMNDRLNQTVMGVFVSLFIYCLLILKTVKSIDKTEFNPNFSVLFAIIFSVVAIIYLIIFIHHISVSIQAENVISDVYQKLDMNIEHLFPGDLGYEYTMEHEQVLKDTLEEYPFRSYILSSKNGYIQELDQQKLMDLSIEHDLVMTIRHRQGDYLVEGAQLVQVNTKKDFNEFLRQKIKVLFILGKHRTLTMDAEFGINQMVEIAAKALSPGINDPFTAITCIDNLSSILCKMMNLGFPSAYRYDKKKKLRVVTDPLTFDETMDVAFSQIRRFAAGNAILLTRLMAAFHTLSLFSREKEQYEAVLRHSELVYNAAKNLHEKEDYRKLEIIYEKILSGYDKWKT